MPAPSHPVPWAVLVGEAVQALGEQAHSGEGPYAHTFRHQISEEEQQIAALQEEAASHGLALSGFRACRISSALEVVEGQGLFSVLAAQSTRKRNAEALVQAEEAEEAEELSQPLSRLPEGSPRGEAVVEVGESPASLPALA